MKHDIKIKDGGYGESKSITRFFLLGTIGFGLGAIIGWILGRYVYFFEVFIIIFISGLLGGALLGFSLGDKSKIKTLSLVSSFSLLIGYIVIGIIFSTYFLQYQFLFRIGILSGMGGICGVMMGLTFRNKPVSVTALALAGAMGFGIGEYFGSVLIEQFLFLKLGANIYQEYPIVVLVKYLIPLSIGGASLGTAIGYLKKLKKI